jgi:hypothetical protein
MAQLVYHENPAQRGRCLPQAFDAYWRRIPVERYGSLYDVCRAVQKRPFEADAGDTKDAGMPHAAACSPVQRSRVWPRTMNCWEQAAHFVAGAMRYLPDSYAVHVWDRQLSSGERHVWPSIVPPGGRHRLMGFSGAPEQTGGRALRAANDATAWYNDLLGGAHLAGKATLTVFGLGSLGNELEQVEKPYLPSWAGGQSDSASGPTPAPQPPTPAPQPPAPPVQVPAPPPTGPGTAPQKQNAAPSRRRPRASAPMKTPFGLFANDN